MLSHKFLIFVLALASVIVPASGSVVTYCAGGSCDQLDTAFNSATSTLAFTAPITFLPSNINLGLTQYTDPSGTTFFDFHSNGTNPDDELATSGSALNVGLPGSGDWVEILLPANVYAFTANIRTASGTANYCIGTGNTANCNNQAVNVTSSANTFVGVVGSAPLTSIWIGNQNPLLSIQSFTLGTQAQQQPPPTDPPADTPEATTLVLIGSGLICFRWLLPKKQAA